MKTPARFFFSVGALFSFLTLIAPVFTNDKKAILNSPFSAIDRHALDAPAEAEQSVTTLAKYLAEPAGNDLEKARSIYRWITDRVAYDLDSFFSGERGDNSPQGVLKTRQCVCEGYARLFEALAKKMKLQVAIVGGFYKGNGPILLKEGMETRHAWNAVKIDGTWNLFDATMGAGTVVNKKWLKRPEEFFFKTPPELLLFSHFPNDAKWQFRTPPLTKVEWDAFPPVPLQIFKMGLPAEKIWKMPKEENIKEFCKFYMIQDKEAILRAGPVTRTLQAGMKYRFQVETADFPMIAFYQKEGHIDPLQKKGPLFEGIIAPAQGILVVMCFEQADGGKGHYLVSYDVE